MNGRILHSIINAMDDEKLVESVREFECLWKVGCKSYKDVRAKENAWKEVANKVIIDTLFCIVPISGLNVTSI